MKKFHLFIGTTAVAALLLFVIPFGSLYLYASIKAEAIRIGISEEGAAEAAAGFVIFGMVLSLTVIGFALAHVVNKELEEMDRKREQATMATVRNKGHEEKGGM